jgi:hypothetical protein
MATGNTDDEAKKLKDAAEATEKANEKIELSAAGLGKTITDMYKYSVEINKTFGQSQQRLTELMGTLTDATPRFNRLGGSMADVQKAMSGIAEASRRNVTADSETLSKVFASAELLDTTVESISNSFLNVGIGLEQIPKQFEDSYNYIRSIGGNAKTVMKSVQDNMDQMNRYQFQGGVQGLTKMAAQASMLRVDMSATLNFADELYSPEKAIDVASAFQRLGVSVGNLADPFQLMNQSINDPSGLQKSLAEVSKQFTYFDEETKTFKINPQGVLTLREMEQQAGIASGTLSKMGLAAAEMDKRLSSINPSIKFDNEDDKQYLSNIASMKDGKYQVQVTDAKGEKVYKDLSEVTQEEMRNLIEEQKNQPKGVEEIARSQMDVQTKISNDVTAIKNAVLTGIAGSKQVRGGTVSIARAASVPTEAIAKRVSSKMFREPTEKTLDTIGDAIKDYSEGNKTLGESISSVASKLGGILQEFKTTLGREGTGALRDMSNTFTDKSMLERGLKNVSGAAVNAIESNKVNREPISSNRTNTELLQQSTQTAPTSMNTKNTMDVSGTIKVDLTTPIGVPTQDQTKFIADIFNSPQFKDNIVKMVTPENPTKQPITGVYS